MSRARCLAPGAPCYRAAMRSGALSCTAVRSLVLALAACNTMAGGDPETGGFDAGSPGTDAGSCAGPVVADPHVAERLACAFPAGARASATSGFDDRARAALPIKHVIV